MDTDGKTEGEMLDRHMSIPQAARAIGIANATVRSLVIKKELDGELVAGRIVVTRDSVNRYRTARADAGVAQ